MTTELEKLFFDTFGIEPKLVESCTKPRHKCSERFVKDCSKCPRAWRKYPQITNRILLELICLINKYSFLDLWSEDIEDLTLEVLDHCITIALDGSLDEATQELKKYKQQVQALFKEE